jgi:hypothetical protein
MSIVEKMVTLANVLDDAKIPHAFGGALALAYCTERARGTVDIDLNVFVDQSQADDVLSLLPDGVEIDEESRHQLLLDGQTRLWWDATPLDLFLNTTPFHVEAAERRQTHEFAGHAVSFLGCSDLAVFKAFFNRSKDWVDLEEMNSVGMLDVDLLIGVLIRYLGPDDERIARVLSLTDSPSR